jgi:hypothetical protein
MKLESADGPCVIDTAFYAVAKCTCLVVAADKKENLLRIADSTNADRKSGLGNLIGISVKKTCVSNKGVLSKSADTCAGYERRERLVESNVTVNTAAAHEQVNSAIGCNLFFITAALAFGIVSHTVEDVDVLVVAQ